MTDEEPINTISEEISDELKQQPKIKVHKIPDTAELSEEYPIDIISFITHDLLIKNCTERETEIIWKTVIEDYKEEELAEELNTSRSNINKIKRTGIGKLLKSKEFQQLYQF